MLPPWVPSGVQPLFEACAASHRREPSLLLLLLAQLLAQNRRMVLRLAGAASAWVATGKAADQPEPLGQSGGAGGLTLQQRNADLDRLALAEAEGLAEVVQPGCAGVIEVYGDGSHRVSLAVTLRRYKELA
nr:hypothetical protein [Synechococcus sp. CCAP 1479/9]